MSNLANLVKTVLKSETKKKGFSGVNSMIFDLLKVGEKISRGDLRQKLVLKRLEEMGVKGDEKNVKLIIKKVGKTIYNSLNSSLANGQNSASFNYTFGPDKGLILKKLGENVWLEKTK